jgi:hypothetical protein
VVCHICICMPVSLCLPAIRRAATTTTRTESRKSKGAWPLITKCRSAILIKPEMELRLRPTPLNMALLSENVAIVSPGIAYSYTISVSLSERI